jgi:TusA-related sulfurtransferase
VFRSKLSGWYQAQMDKLVELTTAAVFPPGVYRFKGRQSGKYMVVDFASLADNALIEQKAALNATADWEVSVVGSKHKLKNVASGKCLDLKTDSATNVDMVQRTCSNATSQLFKMSKSGEGTAFLFETKYAGKGLFVAGHSTGDDAKITQAAFNKDFYSSQWNATALNGVQAQGLFKGMYTLTASHSSKVMGVTSDAADSAVAQYSAAANNPMLHWYAVSMGTLKYQFVNRSSGKCMALASDSAAAAIVQKDCANSDTQVFTLASTGSPDQYTLKSKYNVLVQVDEYSMADGAIIEQSGSLAADPQRRFKLTPILAGEPHRLSFTRTSPDGSCGDFYWYDITQPNGLPLANPAEIFVQLIFAGGKKTIDGKDENPFVAQQDNGFEVAIDPLAYMLPNRTVTSGSCIAGDIYYDATKLAGGAAGPPILYPLCCVKYNGAVGGFVRSPWSDTTFMCQ